MSILFLQAKIEQDNSANLQTMPPDQYNNDMKTDLANLQGNIQRIPLLCPTLGTPLRTALPGAQQMIGNSEMLPLI